ncbi:hypothetical protein [Rhizobium laguerreae]|uniref:hypothetical protein n=1 Tax=Rhizobium laguerreae TaxID=1076926 RepID=UPI001C909F59|nr:hypothetical protein [Rhizobium laguerreae]MBY3564145.1 hypothetical protein [Rhizobium laguerreae]
MSIDLESFLAARGYRMMRPNALEGAALAEFNSCLDQFREWAEAHAAFRNPEIKVVTVFLNSSEANAFAFTEADVIGVNWGLIVKIRELLGQVFDPMNFSWIPEDRRAAAKEWLYESAKFFFFWHEMGHIWNGHTRLAKTAGLAAIDELGATSMGSLSSKDFQTLEMDADSFGATQICSMARRFPFPVKNSILENEQGDGATSLAMLAFSSYLVFSMFGREMRLEEQESWDHPSAPLRQLAITGTISTKAVQMGWFNIDQASYLTQIGTQVAEDAYRSAFKEDPVSEDLAETFNPAFSSEGANYLSGLLEHWKLLRPVLDQLKPGGVLPAVQDFADG